MYFIKQRLHPDTIPGQKQPLSLFFPNSKGENPVKALDAHFAPLCIGMEHYFRIGMAFKIMPAF